MALWTDDDPIIEPLETEDPQAWSATHCNFCGYGLVDDDWLERRGGRFHCSCLAAMEAAGGIDE
jgi:hypothetical protein